LKVFENLLAIAPGLQALEKGVMLEVERLCELSKIPTDSGRLSFKQQVMVLPEFSLFTGAPGCLSGCLCVGVSRSRVIPIDMADTLSVDVPEFFEVTHASFAVGALEI
jgi:hypothetical protein